MDEFAAILDDGMLIVVDWEYIRSNITCFVYIGHTNTGHSIIHTYVLPESQ